MDANEITILQALRLGEQGDHAGAEAIFRHLLIDDPTNTQLLSNHAAALFNLRDYAAAETELMKAISLVPSLADAHINLAVVNFMLGRISRADEYAARAFGLAPDRRDFRERWQKLKSAPFFGAGAVITGLQGLHAPERQVFMSAVVDLLRDTTPHISILEIGSYMGASLLTWANAVARLHGGTATIVCVDPWGLGDTAPQYENTMAAALTSNQAYEIFLHNASLVDRRVTVRPVRGLSEKALLSLEDAAFDIVYVDGCHYYREALFDISESRRLLKEGGILCGDDLELQPDECDLENAQRQVRVDYVSDPRSGRHFHPGVTLAIHELFGRVSSFSGFWAMRKRAGAFTEVSFANARGVLPGHWPRSTLEHLRAHFQGSSQLGRLEE